MWYNQCMSNTDQAMAMDLDQRLQLSNGALAVEHAFVRPIRADGMLPGGYVLAYCGRAVGARRLDQVQPWVTWEFHIREDGLLLCGEGHYYGPDEFRAARQDYVARIADEKPSGQWVLDALLS